MKFNFRLETLMRQRGAERDAAQRIYAEAQNQVQVQLALIKRFYEELDNARLLCDQKQSSPGAKSDGLVQIDEYIDGQKIRIRLAREKARELMAVAEEKLEILVDKMQAYKVLEKLKDKKKLEFKKEYKKKQAKDLDDMTVMRTAHRGER